MAPDFIAFLGGLLLWTFIEYAIHGWLAHSFRTFATPFHQVHHRDPAAVFALGAWIPTALLWLASIIYFGLTIATSLFTGLVVGFAMYELIHYRLHFISPRSRLEARLRLLHLSHHCYAPRACFGVTSPLWDLAFGTNLPRERLAAHSALVAAIPSLDVPSNLARVIGRVFRR